jgi:hypothetical protein
MSGEKSPKIELRYEDVPELKETFADSLGQWHFDGSTLRIDFLVTRFDPPKSPDARSGRKLPVCRLVLPASGAADLLNQCRRITAAIEQASTIKAGKNDVEHKPVN